jgi:uncharacterized protein YjaZ
MQQLKNSSSAAAGLATGAQAVPASLAKMKCTIKLQTATHAAAIEQQNTLHLFLQQLFLART